MIERRERLIGFSFDEPKTKKSYQDTLVMLRYSYIGESFNIQKVHELTIRGWERLNNLRKYHNLIEPKEIQTSLEDLAKLINMMMD